MITVALAVLGRTELLIKTLDSLSRQTLAIEMNVVLLDGNDDRREVESAIRVDSSRFNSLRVWREKECIPAEKRGRWPALYNFLILQSSDTFVCYWSDVFPDNEGVFGRAVGILSDNRRIGAVAFAWRDGAHAPYCVYRTDCLNLPLINFGLIRREAFLSVGGLDEGYYFYHADQDFTNSLSKKGWDIYADPTDPSLRVTHHSGEKSANPFRQPQWVARDVKRFQSKWTR